MERRIAIAMLLSALVGFLSAMPRGVMADELPLVTGEQWTKSSEQVKKAYLVGIANTLQIERAYYGSNPPNDEQSLVPRFVRGVEGQTLDGVRETLNRWYSAHPDRLSRPVIETIWFEIVVPRLQSR